jgi:Ca2+-binding EF-hand superfamily protein
MLTAPLLVSGCFISFFSSFFSFLLRSFKLFDPNNTGTISAADAGVALRTLGKPPSEEELQEMFGGKPVDFGKFQAAVGQLVCRWSFFPERKKRRKKKKKEKKNERKNERKN